MDDSRIITIEDLWRRYGGTARLTAMRAAIAAERHDLAAVLRHRVRLCAHRLLIRSSDGWERAVALEPKSVSPVLRRGDGRPADPSSACLFMVPGASITEATSGFEWGAIRLTMLGCDFEVRPSAGACRVAVRAGRRGHPSRAAAQRGVAIGAARWHRPRRRRA